MHNSRVIKHILGGALLALAGPTAGRAQCYPVFIAHAAHRRANCPADTTTHTERTGRGGFWLGPALVRTGLRTTYAGLDMEGAGFVAPRWQLGGHALVTFRAAAPTSFGLEASSPALALLALTGSARYQLLNTRRWRLDALGGAGGQLWLLADRDRLVARGGRCGCQQEPAPVASALRPLAETGLGLSYKLAREVWLSTQLRYARALGPAPLGSAGLAQQWQLTLGIALPSGFVARQPPAR